MCIGHLSFKARLAAALVGLIHALWATAGSKLWPKFLFGRLGSSGHQTQLFGDLDRRSIFHLELLVHVGKKPDGSPPSTGIQRTN